ncbi:hypothetical protein MLD38_025083 [Melastoma candidum]|uniref:Uncharacterized protein n=1 Tax=Melastoma candidum TaxID=119954 RepID=A0ACB9NUQ2_9MYRT|nr:hypothetical protein MLD38_025083 [Melastoma candidum]
MVFSLTVVLIVSLVSGGQQDYSWTNKECHGQHDSRDAYQENRVMGLRQSIGEIPDAIGYNYYHEEGLGSKGPCYIHATCSRDIQREDCSSCLENAVDKLNCECQQNIGACLENVNCRIRFENFKFY